MWTTKSGGAGGARAGGVLRPLGRQHIKRTSRRGQRLDPLPPLHASLLPPCTTHPPLHRRRLKAIQDLGQADVDSAISKLPRDVSPECVSLLRRIFSIAPAGRPALADIMADPWWVGGWVGVRLRCLVRQHGRRDCRLSTPPHSGPPTHSGPHPTPPHPPRRFKQFLPDLSKLAVAQPREQQGVAEITKILADADRLSQLRQQMRDEFDAEVRLCCDGGAMDGA